MFFFYPKNYYTRKKIQTDFYQKIFAESKKKN